MNKNQVMFLGMGFELVSLIVAAFFIGEYLDQKFSTGSLTAVILTLIAFFLWVFHLITLVKKYQDEEDDQ